MSANVGTYFFLNFESQKLVIFFVGNFVRHGFLAILLYLPRLKKSS